MTLVGACSENQSTCGNLHGEEVFNELFCGDYILNVGSQSGGPTLRPGHTLEDALCLGNEEDASNDATVIQRLGIHIHAYYLPEFEKIIGHICKYIDSCDLLVTTDSLSKQIAIDKMLTQATVKPWERHQMLIRVVPNQGRNVIPLLSEGIKFLDCCDIALHLHTKRSPHTDFGHNWLDYLLGTLIGDNSHVRQILFAFSRLDHLGLLLPRPSEFLASHMNWGGNFNIASMIVDSIWPNRRLNIQAPLIFPPGMMFWFRPKALRPLAKSLPLLSPAPSEPLPEDGTPLHAIERLVVHSCEISAYSWSLLPIRRGQHLANVDISSFSVWKPEPFIYSQCVDKLASQYREVRHRLEESKAAFEVINRCRNELLVDISKRDDALVQAASVVRKLQEDLKQHDQALKLRDQALADATAIVRRLEGDLKQHDQALKLRDQALADATAIVRRLEGDLQMCNQNLIICEEGLTEAKRKPEIL